MLEFIGAAGVILAALTALFLPLALALLVTPAWLWLYVIYVLIIGIFACLVVSSRYDDAAQKGTHNDET